MTEGKSIIDMEVKLSGDKAAAHIGEFIAILPQWFSRCRSGTTEKVLKLLLTAIRNYLEQLTSKGGSNKEASLDEVRGLDSDLRLLDKAFLAAPKHAVLEMADLDGYRERAAQLVEQVSKDMRQCGIHNSLGEVLKSEGALDFDKVRASYAAAVGLRFGETGHVNTLISGSGAIAKQSFATFIGKELDEMTLESTRKYSDIANLCVNIIDLAMEGFGEPSQSEIRLRMKHIARALEVVESCHMLVSLGTVAEQVGHEQGASLFSVLRATLGEFSPLNVGDKELDLPIPCVDELNKIFGKLIEVAKKASGEFAHFDTNEKAQALQEEVTKFRGLAETNFKDNSWKAGLADDCEWEAILERSKATILSTKGLATKLAKQIDAVKGLSIYMLSVAQEYGVEATFKDYADDAENALKAANTTQVEAMMVQILKDPKKSDKDKIVDIMEVLNTLPEKGVMMTDIHKTITQMSNKVWKR